MNRPPAVLDIDDLSSVDVPDHNGMDTLDRRAQNLTRAPENFYSEEGGLPKGSGAPKGGIRVLPLKDKNLKTSNF